MQISISWIHACATHVYIVYVPTRARMYVTCGSRFSASEDRTISSCYATGSEGCMSSPPREKFSFSFLAAPLCS